MSNSRSSENKRKLPVWFVIVKLGISLILAVAMIVVHIIMYKAISSSYNDHQKQHNAIQQKIDAGWGTSHYNPVGH